MKDNLTLWTSELDDEDEGNDDDNWIIILFLLILSKKIVFKVPIWFLKFLILFFIL